MYGCVCNLNSSMKKFLKIIIKIKSPKRRVRKRLTINRSKTPKTKKNESVEKKKDKKKDTEIICFLPIFACKSLFNMCSHVESQEYKKNNVCSYHPSQCAKNKKKLHSGISINLRVWTLFEQLMLELFEECDHCAVKCWSLCARNKNCHLDCFHLPSTQIGWELKLIQFTLTVLYAAWYLLFSTQSCIFCMSPYNVDLNSKIYIILYIIKEKRCISLINNFFTYFSSQSLSSHQRVPSATENQQQNWNNFLKI